MVKTSNNDKSVNVITKFKVLGKVLTFCIRSVRKKLDSR